MWRAAEGSAFSKSGTFSEPAGKIYCPHRRLGCPRAGVCSVARCIGFSATGLRATKDTPSPAHSLAAFKLRYPSRSRSGACQSVRREFAKGLTADTARGASSVTFAPKPAVGQGVCGGHIGYSLRLDLIQGVAVAGGGHPCCACPRAVRTVGWSDGGSRWCRSAPRSGRTCRLLTPEMR